MDEEFIKTYLAVQHGPHGQELLDNLALNLARLASLMDATVAPNPANVSHCGLDTLDMELVLQAHRQTVERARCPPMRLLVVVQILRPFKSLVKEDLEKTGVLAKESVCSYSPISRQSCLGLQSGGKLQPSCRKPWSPEQP